MGYPGDQGNPGGRPSGPSPQPPYGSGAEAPPYGNDNDEAFAPLGEAPGARPFGGDSFGTGPLEAEPFGPPSPAAEPPAGPSGATAVWGEPPTSERQDAFPPGGFGHDQFGQQGGFGPGGQEPGFEQGGFGHGEAPENSPYGAPMPPQGDFDGAPPGEDGPSGRRRGLPLIIGGAVVAGLVLIGGGIGLASMMKDDSKPAKKAPPAAASTRPTAAPSPTVPPLQPVKLQSRATDPVKLSLPEVFGKSSFKAGGRKYVRTATSSTKKCAAVVGGTKLEKALKKGDCNQALRATYALSTGSLIGTIGVLNVKSEADAKAAVKAASDKDAFLLALPGKGVSKHAGKGLAFGTSQAHGHYVVMTWVQRPDGKAIASKYHKAVSVFGAELYKSSDLAFALHYRETEGKPLKK
ncbi:hypothetical protein [Actinomadura sp. NTSP31]|uniref:hypothetical protein n=1 Tax=Actinomadura sp. NTSP31 TaxID=1735447 RepID=UPI0035BFCB93